MKKHNQAIELEILRFDDFKATKWGIIYKMQQTKLYNLYKDEVNDLSYMYDEIPMDHEDRDQVFYYLASVVDSLVETTHFDVEDRKFYLHAKKICLDKEHIKRKLRFIRIKILEILE